MSEPPIAQIYFVDVPVGFFCEGEAIDGRLQGATGHLSLLTAKNLPEANARQLLQELIKRYPLDAIGMV